MSLFLERSIKGFAIDNWSDNQSLVVNTLSNQIDNEINNARNLLQYTASMPYFQNLTAADKVDRQINGLPEQFEPIKRSALKQLTGSNGPFSVVFILFPNGDHYLSHPFDVQKKLKRYNLADRDYFKATTRTLTTSISDSFIGADGKLAIAINTPVFDIENNLIAHLGGVLHLQDLSKLIDADKIAPFDQAIILDRQGKLIAHSDQTQILPENRDTYSNDLPFKSKLEKLARQADQSYLIEPSSNKDKQTQLNLITQLGSGWTLILERSESNILNQFTGHINNTTLLVSVILFSVSGFGIWVSTILSGRWADTTLKLQQSNDSLEDRVQLRTEELEQTRQQLKFALKGSNLGMWDWHIDSGETLFDDQWKLLLGYVPEHLHVYNFSVWLGLVYSEDRPLLQNFAKQTRHQRHFQCELRMRHANGHWCWYECKGMAVEYDTDDSPTRLIGTLQEISERKLTENRLRQSARVFEHAHEGIMITDKDNRIIDVNRAFTELTGFTLEEVKGRQPNMLNSGYQSEHFYNDLWQDLESQGYWKGEIWNRRKDGELFAEQLTITALTNAQGVTDQYIGIFSDITHMKEQQSRLEQMAHYDSLTSLPNRILLADRLEQALSHTNRMQNMLAVGYLDLDNFKPINDQLGHATGDQLLIAVANRLKQCVRSDDTISRLGGDEFVLLLPDQDSVEQCSLTFDRIIAKLAEPYYINNHKLSVSASIGISLYPMDNADTDTLLRHADQAMYTAKQSGRNQYHYFDPNLELAAKQQHDALDEISTGLTKNQFVLHYQPKVDMRSHKVLGVEALIRWQHPERGLLFPDSFLPAIENSDVSITLGNWVLQQAIQQVSQLHQQGLKISVGINIAPRHLESKSFVSDLTSYLQAVPQLPEKTIEIEILETTALEEMNGVSDIISQCHQLGLSVALDDFGTGYSSLTYFKRLPVDTVKVDRSFVIDMLDDEEDYTIVAGVIGLAKAFQRTVVAEGVETEQHGQSLMALGCDQAQGYGIAKAMPPEQLPDWIREYENESVSQIKKPA
ncbi:EAL domain-containing protein [Amphritea balenae]|uniref:EAL domain-containing protein n=1 Tax=Amphritea balenae TaxID=452629 RepID=A0A3P1SPE3_9GAMM|nr:EAL domain-containing protein [Amphritea balenae]RRC98899.1 EAL domain-containing protein [Amphritea balenae]